MSELPYFDLLLEGRRRADPAALAFERYVHWGYWEQPARAAKDGSDFQKAMARLDAAVVSEAKIEPGMTVLDCGCGFGGTLCALAAGDPTLKLTGVNIDPRQLAIASARPEGEKIRWVNADACALPFADASFDRVLAVECIFHFPSRLRFLKEAARVLKPGGRVALSDFVPARPGAASGWLGRKLERVVSRGYGTIGAGWEKPRYAALGAEAGLRLDVDRDVTRNTLPTYPLLMKLIGSGGMGGAKGLMATPTRVLWCLSWLGVVRYRIASLTRA